MSLYQDFFAERFGGSKWVLARRSPRIERRYGVDVVCVSRQRYAAVEREWRELYGDPHDAVRAELYCAAREFLNAINLDYVSATLRDRLVAALDAEKAAK